MITKGWKGGRKKWKSRMRKGVAKQRSEVIETVGRNKRSKKERNSKKT